MLRVILIMLLAGLVRCQNENRIQTLLSSEDKDELISGALKAAKTENLKYVPLLLKNANDPRRSTNLHHKGVCVYQAKMIALNKLLKQDPPVELSCKVDSVVIKFYTELATKKNLMVNKQ